MHRAVLVLGTVVLAVAGSRAAADPKEWPSWGLITAGAVLIVVADIAREFDVAARELGQASRIQGYQDALHDLLDARGTRTMVAGLWVAIGCAAAGFAIPVVAPIVDRLVT